MTDDLYEAAEGTDWHANDHGLWCPMCGWHVAAPWNVESKGYRPPMICRECGFDAEPVR